MAWEGQGLELLFSAGCCFPLPGRPLACGDRGQNVGDSPSVDRIPDGELRPDVDLHCRSSPIFQHLLGLIKELHPAIGHLLPLNGEPGPKSKATAEGSSTHKGETALPL